MASISAVLLYFMFDAGLYYSHRLMHQKWFFKKIHRHHHKYVAPTIFTMTATHPVEFMVFQSVLLVNLVIKSLQRQWQMKHNQLPYECILVGQHLRWQSVCEKSSLLC